MVIIVTNYCKNQKNIKPKPMLGFLLIEQGMKEKKEGTNIHSNVSSRGIQFSSSLKKFVINCTDPLMLIADCSIYLIKLFALFPCEYYRILLNFLFFLVKIL